MVKYFVEEEHKGKRLDIFLSEKMEKSRSQIKKLITLQLVTVDGNLPKKAGDNLQTDSIVEVKDEEKKQMDQKRKEEIAMQDFDVQIIEESDSYIVVNKPAGMLVHPTEADEPNTLAHFLVNKYPEIKDVGESEVRPGIMHRLDKEASGLIVIARDQNMFNHLKSQFQSRTVEKIYSVLVHGSVEKDHGEIDFDIDRGRDGKMVARPKIDKLRVKNVGKEQEGKDALTEYWVKKKFPRYTLLKAKIHTGRTHQIRVHFFAHGNPVVGDTLYTNKKVVKERDTKLERLFLHAKKLCFSDFSSEIKCFESDLPIELNNFIDGLNSID